MHPITPCTLIALALASCVAASTRLVPDGHPTDYDGALKYNPFQHPDFSDVVPKIAKYLELRTLARFGRTDKALNALTSMPILYAKTTQQQLVKIIQKAANNPLTTQSYDDVCKKLVDDFILVRDQFIKACAGFNMDPIHLPPCFKIAPNYRGFCFSLLDHVAKSSSNVIKSDWILISPLDFVKNIISTNAAKRNVNSKWYLEHAKNRGDYLFREINVDDSWSEDELLLYSEIFEYLEANRKTDN